jgi:hypothetical protein
MRLTSVYRENRAIRNGRSEGGAHSLSGPDAKVQVDRPAVRNQAENVSGGVIALAMRW